MYANAVICLIWFFIVVAMPSVGNRRTMSLSLVGINQSGANKMLDALLSIDGVIEAVIVEGEEVAYLKVDDDRLDSQALHNLPGADGKTIVGA